MRYTIELVTLNADGSLSRQDVGGAMRRDAASRTAESIAAEQAASLGGEVFSSPSYWGVADADGKVLANVFIR